jgi:hypothetical protein
MRTLLALSLLQLVSCTGEKDQGTTKASASAAPDPAADLGSYCEKVCKKSTTCGVEAAEKLAKGHAHELKLIEELRKDAPKTEETCTSACKASTVTSEDAALLARAKSCLDQTTCDTFDRCLEAVDKPQGGT